jgi:tetratricopeptide (TPR) repeat protein
MLRSAGAVLLGLLLAASSFAVEPPRERERWTSIPLDELTIYSNEGEAVARHVAISLTRMRDALSRFTRLSVRSPLPTNVYVFANERSFVPYCEALRGRCQQTVGLFLGTRDANYVMIQSGSQIDRIVYHELAHYFLRNTVTSPLPLWFNEGLAEFYSTFVVHGDDIDVGRPISDHVLALRSDALIPLRELFAVTTSSKLYNEGARQGMFYAESWALVHYLMFGDAKRQGQLGKFLGLVGSGRPAEEAFAAAFNARYEDIEIELRQYVRSMTMSYTRYKAADLPPMTIPAAQPVPRDVLLVTLADLLSHSRGDAANDADSFLDAALQANPNNADAYAQRGSLYARMGKRPEADAAFEKAAQLGSKSFVPYLMYADSLMEQIDTSMRRNAGAPPDKVARARELYRKAIAINPSSARAHAGLGATYIAGSDDPAPGIEALQRSLALAPAQDDVTFNLIGLYVRSGRRDEAAKLAGAFPADADPEMVRQARESILYADIQRAETMLHQGKRAESLALMKSVIEQTTNPQLKQQVGSAVSVLEQDELLQQALEKAQSGRYREALAFLDQIMPTLTNPDVLENAKELRAKVAVYVRK